jgi:hypothetical protein
VTATSGETTERAELSKRFMAAIDAAAMRAGLVGMDEYLEQWRRAARPCGDDVGSEVAAEVARLEESYPPEELRRLVRAGGSDDPPSAA